MGPEVATMPKGRAMWVRAGTRAVQVGDRVLWRDQAAPLGRTGRPDRVPVRPRPTPADRVRPIRERRAPSSRIRPRRRTRDLHPRPAPVPSDHRSRFDFDYRPRVTTHDNPSAAALDDLPTSGGAHRAQGECYL